MARYFTLQNTTDTSITSGTLVGQLGFAASNDSDGGDAIVITAAVIASADGTFDATNNPGSLVFATSPTGPATGQIKIVDSGHLEPIGNKIKNLGSSSSQWKDLYVDQIYFDGLGPQTLPFNDFNVSATGDTVTVTDGNTVTFTGQDSVTVSRDGQTIIISGAAGGGGGVSTGPAQTIAFFSGDGSLTGTSDFTYDEALTSVKLVTQGDTLTTGYYIQNAQTQTGNMFQVDTYIETIQRNTISGDVIADTGDGYVSTQQPPGSRFDNTSTSLDFTYQAGGSINSTGMLPFNIPNFDADLSAEDIEDGARVRVYNSNANTPQQVAITGYLAIYTGSADPSIPQDEATFMSYGAQVGLSTPLIIGGPWGAGSTGNVSESDDFTPALQQYFSLHPSNTGNIIVFWYPTSTYGSPAQNQVYSSDNSDSGVSPRLTLQYYSYSGTDTFVDKTNYVVDYQGKLRLNTNDYANVGNQNMIYVSGQENLPCNMVLNSSNGQTKIVHWRGDQKLFTVGGNTPGTDWSIFDNVNSSKPIKIDNTEPSYGTYRDEQVIMRWKGGKVGIYDTSPDYDLDIHGDLGVRSGIYLYNGETVGYDETAHRLYRSGNTLMWNGSAVSGGAGGGGGMTSWDLGVGTETTSTITDGDTVTFSGLNQISTTRSTNRIDIDIDLSAYYTAAQVDTISGNLQTQIDANDNYQYWTITDGVTSENIATTDTVKFTGGSNINVGYNSSNNTVTISSSAGGGSMSQWDLSVTGDSTTITDSETVSFTGQGNVSIVRNGNTVEISGSAGGGGMTSWDLGVGAESVIDVTDGESVTFSGLNQITTTRTSQRIDIDVDLSDYYTSAQVDTISGNLQTQIDANDNYQYWTITDGVNSENVSTTDTIKFTGGGDVGVSYNTSNNTVTISATAGGGGTPGGNSTEFQYNNGGSFAGTTGVVYGATNGTGTIFEVHGTGSPKDTLFAVEYTGVDTPTTVSIYNNDGQTANTFQVLTEGSGDLFTVSPTGKIYYNSSYSKIANSGNIGSSMTFDLDTSNIFTGTLTTTSITLSTTNEDVGQRFMLRLKQDGTGSRTVGTWFGSRVKWPGGSAPTLSTGANLVDLFGFLVTSGSAGTFYYDGFTIATGLQ